ncbi:RNA polymerase sigma factor (sigma-70 family) [Catalinimonas alkaloidigena]|uniref:RNA polymerase sigma factor n=1 Tax=Catalinimonas alkaloidigena TaxID=1075417 RepID=UPI0024054B5D|nr:sigma-70 family RNA polymerase sigma factor [Catalinimonas alkaloidigena]MDF9800036.1 RNA polymerase sigma factor (sigma-70 family) [Catalinimonas alkaloidigena]
MLLTQQKSVLKEDFTHIISQHQGIVHKVCRIYRDTPEDREDLFQDILYQLWKSWPSFRGEAQVSSWMYKVALSTAIARYRKPSVFQNTIPLTAQEGEERQQAEHPEKEKLYRAIALLNDADKAIITLYLDDYAYEEIAEIIGISVNYVGVKINRIKAKLSQLLNPKSHEPG